MQAKSSLSKLDRESLALALAGAQPDYFLENILKTWLTPDQRLVAESVRDNRRTLVTAGHGVGKTHLAGRLALWFLVTKFNSKVITTAPTGRQVKNLLWKELRTAYAGARWPIGGHLNQTDLAFSDAWFALGLSTNDVTNFQGYHAPWVMMVYDEATGVAPAIWEAAEGVAIGPDDRFLAIGNPTDPASRFKQADDSGTWNVIRLSCENHPNVIENRQIVPGAVSKQWIEERFEDYGRDRESPLYRARVRGLWPEDDDDTIVPLRTIEASNLRHLQMLEDGDPKKEKPIALGVDVARFGVDETVFVTVRPNGFVEVETYRGRDLMTTVGKIVSFAAAGVVSIAIDDSGVGGGVTDRLNELKRQPGMNPIKRARIIPVNNAERCTQPERFANVRAETFWWLREAMLAGSLHLPVDRRMEADLSKPKRQYDSHGRIKVESKEDLKKPDRLGRSPDRGDAVVLAWAAFRQQRIAQNAWTF